MPNKNDARPSTGPYIVRVNPKSFEGRTFYYEIWAYNGLGDRIAAVEMKLGAGRRGEAKANADLLSAGPEAAELVDAILAQARDGLDRSDFIVAQARKWQKKAGRVRQF